MVTLNKNADIDQYKLSGYGIGFDRKGDFSVTHEVGTNVIIFGVDMSLSPHIDNKKNYLILGKGPKQELEHRLTAEKMYSINFSENNKKNLFELEL